MILELKFGKLEFQPKIQLFDSSSDQHKSDVELKIKKEKKKEKNHMELEFAKLEFQLGKSFTVLELEFQVGKIF